VLTPEVKALLGKELRQLLRSRAAVASALLLPLLLLVVVPVLQMLGITRAPVSHLPPGVPLPPGLQGMAEDPKVMVRALLPLFIALGGLVVPSVTAVHALIAEREGRTLELLVALPVRVGHILLAKVLALLALAVPVTFCLYAVDVVVMLATGVGTPALALALWALLIAALAFSTCGALLVSLLARDFRTANNLTGLLVGPSVAGGLGVALLSPGPVLGSLVLAALLTLGAAGALWLALRVVTFERLLR
jgi:ABC-2 type transport system permease protein